VSHNSEVTNQFERYIALCHFIDSFYLV
jgi:hypothetical protein